MAKAQSDGDRDAIDLLTEDHKRVQKLFKDFERTGRDDEEALREVVETACVELQIHAVLEEEIFYPAVRVQAQDDAQEDLLNQAEVEHEAVDELIAKLHELGAGDAMYAAYFSVLSEYVKHHIREEEKALFPQVKKMTALDLQQLAEDMRLRREEVFAEIESDDESELEASSGEDDDAGTSAADELLEDEEEQIPPTRARH